MMNDIRIMLRDINRLTGQELHLFRYSRAKNPYGLMDDRSQEIFRGNKEDLYNYLEGMLKGIELYRSMLHNAGLDTDLLLESLQNSTDE